MEFGAQNQNDGADACRALGGLLHSAIGPKPNIDRGRSVALQRTFHTSLQIALCQDGKRSLTSSAMHFA